MTHYLFGEINSESAAALIGAVDAGCLHISINSQGGDIEDGLAIYDCLRRVPGISVEATGRCMSAAVLVLLGADCRLATPHTRFMLHAPFVSSYADVDFEEIAAAKAEVDDLTLVLQKIILERTHDKCAAALCSGPVSTYFTVDDAREMGILNSLQ